MRSPLICLVVALAVSAWGPRARAADKVGELHRLIPDAVAAVRDAGGDAHARMTVWYPAAVEAVEQPVVIGPPGQPVFVGGQAALDARWRDRQGRYPLILISHGFGGTGEQNAWLGTVLARRGFVVATVDHPGNNGRDKMTLAGTSLWWLRADDLRAVLAALAADPAIAPHVDASRLGVAGFSIGGFTALDLAGAWPQPERYPRHCQVADDGICKPQKELPGFDPGHLPPEALALWRDHPPIAETSPKIRALFLLAPAMVPAFSPASLRAIRIPTVIVLGQADTVATPRYNGMALARLMPRAKLVAIPRVNHYDFLDDCTPAGQAHVAGYCRPLGDQTQTIAHRVATAQAIALFERALR